MPTRRQHGTWWISTRAMSTTTVGDPDGDSDASGVSLTYRTRKPQFWHGGGRVHQLQCRVGSSSGTSETNFQERDRLRHRSICGRQVRSAIVTSLFASGYCRAWSSANGVNPRASAWAGPQGLPVVASVNPYLTGRGRLLIQRRTDDQLYEGAGKSKGKSFARTLPAAKPPGWTRKLYGTAFGWSSEARGILLAPVHHRGADMSSFPTLTEKDKTLGRGCWQRPWRVRTVSARGSAAIRSEARRCCERGTACRNSRRYRLRREQTPPQRGSLPTFGVLGTGRCLIPIRWKSWTQSIGWWGRCTRAGFRHRMERILDGHHALVTRLF